MKCAKCGAEIRTGCVYCAVCGQEAQIVTELNILEDDLLRSMLDESKTEEETQEKDREKKRKQNPKKEGPKKKAKKKRRKKTLLILTVILIIVCAVAAGMFFYYRGHSTEYLMGKAETAYSHKDYQKSLEYLDRVLKLDAENEDALLMRGEICALMKDEEQAEEIFLQVISANPSCEQAYTNLLELYEDQGNYKKISELYEQVTDDNIKALFFDYVVLPPLIGVESGTYTDFFEVSISCQQDDMDIYYTLDGSKPTKNDTKYEEPVEISESGETVLKAVCMDIKGNYSEVSESIYNVELMAPDMPGVTPDGGQFTETRQIRVTVPEGVSVYYTWDGSTPDASSTKYDGPITMPEGNNILSLIAIDRYGMKSEVLKCNYIYYPE